MLVCVYDTNTRGRARLSCEKLERRGVDEREKISADAELIRDCAVRSHLRYRASDKYHGKYCRCEERNPQRIYSQRARECSENSRLPPLSTGKTSAAAVPNFQE